LENGLSAAIMNPYSVEMMKAYYSYCALCGLDANCGEYINFANSIPAATAVGTVLTKDGATDEKYKSELQKAIIKGLKEQSAQLCRELIKTVDPLSVVQEEIIPALDIVGVGFENKTVYLPQLLMSADASSRAFAVLKDSAKFIKESGKKIIIATVKGDIHDIGKNIVKLLLESYGFDVIDLGKNVDANTVLEAVKYHKCNIVALSALMTTTLPAMEETVRLLHSYSQDVKVMVGGAVLTQDYADKIGADAYGKDAMAAVSYANKFYTDVN
jgi:5-methyltetrahydrofolate--homocysteine methyltransferase